MDPDEPLGQRLLKARQGHRDQERPAVRQPHLAIIVGGPDEDDVGLGHPMRPRAVLQPRDPFRRSALLQPLLEARRPQRLLLAGAAGLAQDQQLLADQKHQHGREGDIIRLVEEVGELPPDRSEQDKRKGDRRPRPGQASSRAADSAGERRRGAGRDRRDRLEIVPGDQEQACQHRRRGHRRGGEPPARGEAAGGVGGGEDGGDSG